MSPTEQQLKYVDIIGLAASTGLSISTINRLKKQGKIPFFQPGGRRARVLFPVDAIEGRVPSQALSGAAPPADKPGAAEVDQAGSPQSEAFLPPIPEPSRLPGPMPRWRRRAR